MVPQVRAEYRLWFKFLTAPSTGAAGQQSNVKRYRSRAAAEKRLALVSQYEGNILREYRISQVPRRDTL